VTANVTGYEDIPRRGRSVAIVGGFAAGKTTLSDGLIQQGWTRVSFAKRLKELAQAVYGEPVAEFLAGGRAYAPVDKAQEYDVTRLDGTPESLSGRRILQELGQSVKSLDRDFWVKWMLRDIRDNKYGHAPYVTDDCRFPYEADALSDAGFIIVKLEVPVDTRIMRYYDVYGVYPTPAEIVHPSEIELVNIVPDYVIDGEKPPKDILAEVYRVATRA
jgi:hypothetical protein